MQVSKPSPSLLSSHEFITEETAARVAVIPYLHNGDWTKRKQEPEGVRLAQDEQKKRVSFEKPNKPNPTREVLQLKKRCSFVRSPALCTPILQLFPYSENL